MMEPMVITRVSNACVLLEFGEDAVLTDPWFQSHWGFTETPGLSVADLPRLAAIVGSHTVFDHWNIDALRDYPYRATTPVLVATARMLDKAHAAGFDMAELVQWGATRRLSERLSVEVVEGQWSGSLRVNSYVFASPRARVFFGGEAHALEPLRRYRETHAPVDVFLGPCNGIRLLGRQLVMSAEESVEAARLLGATTMVPIHYAHRRIGPFASPRGRGEDVVRAAGGGIEVVCLKPGVRWTWTAAASS